MEKYILNKNTMELTCMEDGKIILTDAIKSIKEYNQTLKHLKSNNANIEIIEKIKIEKNEIITSAAATKKEIKEELKKFYDVDTLKVTNYFDEDNKFYTDIEIQLYENDEYIGYISIQSFEYDNKNEYDFYDLCSYFEGHIKGTKNKLKTWLENNYGYNVEVIEGYHA